MHVSFSLYYRAPSGRHIPVEAADSLVARLKGLMGRREGNYGFFVVPCRFVHTLFMRYPLDILFLDSENQVVGIKRSVKPWRIVLPVRGASKALKFPSSLHATAFVNIGDTILFY